MLTEQKSQSDLPDNTPVVSSAPNLGGMVDEKKNMSSQTTSEALPTSTTRCLRSARLPTILYCLSLIIGFVATGLTLSSDARDENNVPNRAIYAFIFFIAAMLFDAGRIARAAAAAALDDVPDLEPADSPDEEKENTEEEAKLEFQELKELDHAKSASVIEMKELKSNFREEKSVDNDSISRTSSQATRISLSRPPTYLQRAIATGRELMPTVWAAQAFSLFMQNAIEEPIVNGLMPYTTLTGLAAGYVFHVSIKPWPLWGIRNWIFNNRNIFTAPELFFTFNLSSLLNNSVCLVFSVTTAAFWSGYNFYEFSTGVFEKLFSRKLKSESFQSESLLEAKSWNALPSICSSIVMVTSGACLMAASIILLLRVSPDSGGVLNFSAQWLESIGGYLLTYPLGIYLGYVIIAKGLQKSMLTICTYLLVPFAAPGLTILHYFLSAGAGLCGGVAHSVINHRYTQQLAVMQRYRQEIDALIQMSPEFFMAVHRLAMPMDILLHIERKKHTKMKIFINLFLTIAILIYGFLEINSTTSGKILLSFLVFCIINSMLSFNYWIPRHMPSIYHLQPLSNRLRFFYLNSFSLSFLTKVYILIYYSIWRPFWYKHDFSDPQNQSFNSANSYGLIALLFVNIFTVKVAHKRFFGGYIPYVPRIQQINQLKVLQNPEKLKDHLTAGNQTIRLSYHLFKFMQENYQNSTRVVPTSDNGVNSQPPEPAFLREAKGDGSQHCRHPWSPRLQWQAVPVVQPFSAPDPQGLPSTAIATLHCGDCKENILTCELGFDEEDRAYTRQRFDIIFELRVADAAVRGSTVASQFAMGLPQGLSLSKGVTSFTL